MTQRKLESEDKRPLLYIAQPSFDEAKLSMQRTFVIKSQVPLQQETEIEEAQYVEEQVQLEPSEEQESEQMEVELNAAASEAILEDGEVVEENESDEEILSQQQSDGSWKSKPFKEMNNTEKIGFLVHRPHYIPKVKCHIRTLQQTFIGYVLAYEDGNVTIKMIGNAKEVRVKHEDIVSIRMIGL